MPAASKSGTLTSVEDALNKFLSVVRPVERVSKVELDYLDNRILSRAIVAPLDYPHYDVCFMDGYAVRSEDMAGCGPCSGVLLRLSDNDSVRRGYCQLVHTGSALPEGADSVVMVEDTVVQADGVRIFHETKPGENFTPRGKVMKQGATVFKAGMQLKPTNVALLASLGLTSAEVYDKPRVLIIPTGDELVERGRKAGPGAINESNGLMCQLLVKRYGGRPAVWDIVPDDVEKLTEAVKAGLDYDLIVTTGGTSVGRRDLMPQIVASLGRVVVHGVGMKPGRPVGMGYVEDDHRRTPVVFLPGFPDACAVSAMFFVDRAVRKLGHYAPSKYPKSSAILSGVKPASRKSRSMVKVLLQDGIATAVHTVGPTPYDGEYAYVIVPEDVESFVPGQTFEVEFLE
jgi:molybdopterin molybdotransferase